MRVQATYENFVTGGDFLVLGNVVSSRTNSFRSMRAEDMATEILGQDRFNRSANFFVVIQTQVVAARFENRIDGILQLARSKIWWMRCHDC